MKFIINNTFLTPQKSRMIWTHTLSLPRKVKMLLFLSAFIFLLGAIGIEMISGAYWQANNFVYNMNYRILNAIEEGLENFGSIIAIYALIVYTKGNNKIIKKII